MKTTGICIAVVMLALAGLVPAAGAQERCYQIISGPGAGAAFEATDGIVSQGFRGISGFLSSEMGCPCLHFHGTLFGRPDPNQTGCGWGCVAEIPCPDEIFDQLADVIEQIPDLDVQDKLFDLAEDMLDAITGRCWSKVGGLRQAAFHELWAAGKQVLIETKLVERTSHKFSELELFGLGHTMLINNDETTHVPPAPESTGCTLRLHTVEGSGSNQVLRAVAKKIAALVPDNVVLRAEGQPPGGTYTWSISPPSETNKFTAAGCDATYSATAVIKGVRVQVEYACPDGKRLIRKHPINTIDNTARK